MKHLEAKREKRSASTLPAANGCFYRKKYQICLTIKSHWITLNHILSHWVTLNHTDLSLLIWIKTWVKDYSSQNILLHILYNVTSSEPLLWVNQTVWKRTAGLKPAYTECLHVARTYFFAVVEKEINVDVYVLATYVWTKAYGFENGMKICKFYCRQIQPFFRLRPIFYCVKSFLYLFILSMIIFSANFV